MSSLPFSVLRTSYLFLLISSTPSSHNFNWTMASQDNESPNYGSINKSRPPIHLHASLESLDVDSDAFSSLMKSSSSPSRPKDATAGQQGSTPETETMLLTSPLIRRFSHNASSHGEVVDSMSINTPKLESIDTAGKNDNTNTKKGDSE